MNMLTLILLIIAAVCFALAAFDAVPGINLVAVGLFAWVLTLIVPALH
jgi:hypothetical protein